MRMSVWPSPTSRIVLAMIRNSGEEPQIVEFLKTPPTTDELVTAAGRIVAASVCGGLPSGCAHQADAAVAVWRCNVGAGGRWGSGFTFGAAAS
ncbi:MAG: hypothetical protein U1E33_09110, partial [Rhodospirillales bacterium]